MPPRKPVPSFAKKARLATAVFLRQRVRRKTTQSVKTANYLLSDSKSQRMQAENALRGFIENSQSEIEDHLDGAENSEKQARLIFAKRQRFKNLARRIAGKKAQKR